MATTLRVGQLSTTFVEIAGEDSLVATSGTQTEKLSKFAFLGLVTYSATMTGDEEGKSINVAFNRGPMDTGAPRSVLTLPAKFELTGPVAGTTFVRGKDAIDVRWDNSGKPEPIRVNLSGSCIEGVDKTAPSDSGSLVISSTEIKASKDNEMKTCDVSVTVKRVRTGELDPAYGKGGVITGVQARSLSVKSAP